MWESYLPIAPTIYDFLDEEYQVYINPQNTSATYYFWAGFLGNYNGTDRNEDAIYTTALAVNILLDLYTYQSGTTLIWIEYDSDVEQMINNGIAYINLMISDPYASRLNAFFSEGAGSNVSLYNYPGNYAEFFNGTTLNPQTASLS